MLDAATLRNTLIVRTDRIGDVLLTLPMAGAVKRRVPEGRVTFLIREYAHALVEACPDVDDVLVISHAAEIPRILTEIRSRQFSSVFCPSPSLTIARTMRRAEIPVRVGTAYRWYASMFTHRVFEHRKNAARHEAQYNVRMIDPDSTPTPLTDAVRFALNPDALAAAQQWCADNDITDDAPYIIVHPGSGGSAKDLPPEKFAHIVARVAYEIGARVVLTGLPEERTLLASLRTMSGINAPEAIGLPLDVLAALISGAECLISNSTGVLHIAAAVGTFVVGMYPPIIACSPRRWGPWTERSAVFVPDVDDPCGDCVEASCAFQNCMRMISIDHIIDVVRTCVTDARAQQGTH